MKRMILFFGFLLMAFGLAAQAVDTTGLANNPVLTDPDITQMINAYELLYGALVIGWGVAAKLLGLKARVSHFVFVVLAGGLVLAGAFIAFGLAETIPLAITFISSLGLWDLFGKTIERQLQKRRAEAG